MYLTAAGQEVTILSRHAPAVTGGWQQVLWDARSLGDWSRVLNGSAGLVNLAGRSVDCLKTPAHCDEILRSRVEATRVLGAAIRSVQQPPPVWVQMSTAHIYGDPLEAVCTEQSAFGYGLAPTVGVAWEREFERQVLPTQRPVVLRTSFVLGRDRGAGNGALAKLSRVARIGLGGRVGSGRQGFSWIHETDLNRIFLRSLVDSHMQGAYVVSSPNPNSQAKFMRELRKAVGMPVGLPAPAWLVRIGAPLLFRTDPELALQGRYVIPQRLQNEGFRFEFASLGDALADLV
jgi:uncharacterized protein (TIGR01777 family)